MSRKLIYILQLNVGKFFYSLHCELEFFNIYTMAATMCKLCKLLNFTHCCKYIIQMYYVKQSFSHKQDELCFEVINSCSELKR